MFLLMLAGYVLTRKDILNEEGTKQASSILMFIASPAVIIASYQRAFEIELAKQLFMIFILCVIAYVIAATAAQLLFKKGLLDFQDKRMCVVFSNNGFMAIPLLQALLGSTGVFLGSALIVAGNVFLWTYGAKIMGGEKYKINLKAALINPGVFAMGCGFLLFVSPVKFPENIYQVCNYLGAINTPLAMIVLGAFLARTDLIGIIKDKSIYKISFYKLVLVPAVLMLIMLLLPVNKTIAAVLLIGAAAPTGIVTAMFAQQFNTNYLYSTKVIALTTLLCIITMPIFLTIIEFYWK